MTEYSCFPFHVDEIFFSEMELRRRPDKLKAEVELVGQIKVISRNDEGKLQVNVKLVSSKEDTDFYLNIEAVALFDYLDETADNNLDLLTTFVNEHALFLIWIQFKAFLKIVTVSMGLDAFSLPIPKGFAATKENLFPKLQSEDSTPD